ncbi:MAG: hypothetical protein AB9834_20370 [Lentimicrobium sp.]
MDLKKCFLLFIPVSLFLAVQLCAQQRAVDANKYSDNFYLNTLLMRSPSDSMWKPCITPFLELGGKGWISLNIDFRIKETFTISAGVAGIEEGIAPNVMGYFFGGKRHRLEMGGGLSVNFGDADLLNMFVHGVIGYRYQKKKGLLFRAGFTPMYTIPFTDEGNYAFIPWAGISLGYSF